MKSYQFHPADKSWTLPALLQREGFALEAEASPLYVRGETWEVCQAETPEESHALARRSGLHGDLVPVVIPREGWSVGLVCLAIWSMWSSYERAGADA